MPSLAHLLKGESGLGKSTLINTLFNTPLYPPKQPVPPSNECPKTVAIESIGAGLSLFLSSSPRVQPPSDIEENGVRLHLTVVDTPGFGDFVNNDDRYENFQSVRTLLDTSVQLEAHPG